MAGNDITPVLVTSSACDVIVLRLTAAMCSVPLQQTDMPLWLALFISLLLDEPNCYNIFRLDNMIKFIILNAIIHIVLLSLVLISCIDLAYIATQNNIKNGQQSMSTTSLPSIKNTQT